MTTLLSQEQLRFVRLHQQRPIIEWRHILGGVHIRASSDHGDTATIAVNALDDLVAAGLVERIGMTGVRLTEMGCAI